MKNTDNPDWNGHINLKRYPVDHDRDNTLIVINWDTPKHVIYVTEISLGTYPNLIAVQWE